ncbi:MAG: branched-chain amino acid ABC transporter permease [Anaerolineaceae bacterium]|nr:branched-chain amino acid ABC transporter permease [Anaerolineaceae bacterium]
MPEPRYRLIVTTGLLVVLLVLPLLIDNNKTLTTAILTFIIAALAASWNIVGGFAGQISLGHAAFFGIGSLVTRWLWLQGMPLGLSILASGLAAAAAAFVLGFPGLRLKGIYFAIGTLALAEAIRITVGNLLPGISALPATALREYSLTSRYYLSFAVLLLTVAISAWLTQAKVGLGMMSVREDEDAARAIGINVFRHKLAAFTLSAALAGLAGSSFAYFHVSYYPSLAFSPEWTFDALIVTFVGGVGTVVGPLLGAIFFVLIRDVLAANLVGIHLLIFGVLFVIVVLLLPGGMIEVWDRFRLRQRPYWPHFDPTKPAKESD